MAKLQNGYSVIIRQKDGLYNKPIYPYTRATNVFVTTDGLQDTTIKDYVDNLVASASHIPTDDQETSNYRYLRNDKTWYTLPDASTSVKGVVQLSSATDSSSETVAATAKAVKDVADAAAPKAWIGASGEGDPSTTGHWGIAPLDTTGQVPAAYLPSFVSDVYEVRLAKGSTDATKDLYTTAYDANNHEVAGKSNAIYVFSIGTSEEKTNNTYRWIPGVEGESVAQFVEISKSLAIGEEAGTAFAGNRGVALETAVSGLTTRMGTAEGTITDLGTRMTAAEGAITTAEGDIDSLESRMSTTESDIDDAESAITGLDTRVTTAEGTITNHGSRITTVEGKLANCPRIIVSDDENDTQSLSDGDIWIQIVDDETDD